MRRKGGQAGAACGRDEETMPKKKTKKSAAKRFRRTGGGRLKYGKPGRGHLLTSKTTKRKRGLRATGILSRTEERRINTLIPK